MRARAARWHTAESHAGGLISRLYDIGWPADVLLSVNFPDVPAASVTATAVTRQGRRIAGTKIVAGTDPRNRPYYWIGASSPEDVAVEGTDVGALADGAISVTPLHLDLTHEEAHQALTRQLGCAIEGR